MQQSKNKNFNQHIKNAVVVVNDFEKSQPLLDDIYNSNNALKLLKQGGHENYLSDISNKINKDLQNKQKQFLDMCKLMPEVTRGAL